MSIHGIHVAALIELVTKKTHFKPSPEIYIREESVDLQRAITENSVKCFIPYVLIKVAFT